MNKQKQDRKQRHERPERPERQLRAMVTEVPPRRRFAQDADVRYCGRPAVVIEVVPPQGRPASAGVDVYSMRAMESYVVQFEQGGKVKRAWPPCHELEA